MWLWPEQPGTQAEASISVRSSDGLGSAAGASEVRSSAPLAAPPSELQQNYPPGTRLPLTVERVRQGVRCPDGSYLPLLNGVPEAPPITRRPELGGVPPVVAILVDERGDKWYEHADGSATTTRFRTVLADGVARVDTETVHNARIPSDFYKVRR